jgi:sulfur-carrier protein
VKLHVLYFARLRESLGCSSEHVEQLRAWMLARGGAWQEAFAGGSVRCAVDQVMAADGDELRDGAEVAFFPPVTGG